PLRIRRGDDVWKFHGTRVLDPYQLEYEVERWPPIGVRVADRCQSRRSASYAPNRLNGPEPEVRGRWQSPRDRKSTRLNSSHVSNSYAVFCLKKKEEYRKRYVLADIDDVRKK